MLPYHDVSARWRKREREHNETKRIEKEKVHTLELESPSDGKPTSLTRSGWGVKPDWIEFDDRVATGYNSKWPSSAGGVEYNEDADQFIKEGRRTPQENETIWRGRLRSRTNSADKRF